MNSPFDWRCNRINELNERRMQAGSRRTELTCQRRCLYATGMWSHLWVWYRCSRNLFFHAEWKQPFLLTPMLVVSQARHVQSPVFQVPNMFASQIKCVPSHEVYNLLLFTQIFHLISILKASCNICKSSDSFVCTTAVHIFSMTWILQRK